MSFALRHGDKDYPLSEDAFFIGRNDTCHLCLHDAMASRNHASVRVVAQGVQVEDLQSRNGVFVNGQRISGAQQVGEGDQIKIGAALMKVVRRGRFARAETLMERPTTSPAETFGLLGGLAEKALALGHGDEAERILTRQLEAILLNAEKGKEVSAEEFTKSVEYALKIGVLTKKAKWFDFLFRMHGSLGRLMDAELVNVLYSVVGKAAGASPAHLRIYLEVVREQASNYAPGEKFVLKRIEGLEALLS